MMGGHSVPYDGFGTAVWAQVMFRSDHPTLALRMPSPVHEFFETFLADEMRDQVLNQIANRRGAPGTFAAEIDLSVFSWRRGSQMECMYNVLVHTVRCEPDGQFQHEDAAYPGVALEVSCSE